MNFIHQKWPRFIEDTVLPWTTVAETKPVEASNWIDNDAQVTGSCWISFVAAAASEEELFREEAVVVISGCIDVTTVHWDATNSLEEEEDDASLGGSDDEIRRRRCKMSTFGQPTRDLKPSLLVPAMYTPAQLYSFLTTKLVTLAAVASYIHSR